MVNLVGKVPPLEASGAAVTLVHPTATTVAGQWDVTYPQDMPEDDKPNLGPTRTFGYAHRLVDNPPRFARRHVRRDVQIDARDKNGWSNAESQLDSAARELSGDVVFQRTLTGDDLGVLVPNVDFKQGDVLPLLVWGMIVPATCTSIRYTLEDGRRTVEVGFGPDLQADTAGLAETMSQIDRQMRAEAAGIDEYLAKQLDEAKAASEQQMDGLRTYVDEQDTAARTHATSEAGKALESAKADATTKADYALNNAVEHANLVAADLSNRARDEALNALDNELNAFADQVGQYVDFHDQQIAEEARLALDQYRQQVTGLIGDQGTITKALAELNQAYSEKLGENGTVLAELEGIKDNHAALSRDFTNKVGANGTLTKQVANLSNDLSGLSRDFTNKVGENGTLVKDQRSTSNLIDAMVHGKPHRELTNTQFQQHQQSVNKMQSAFNKKQVDINTGFQDLFDAQAVTNAMQSEFNKKQVTVNKGFQDLFKAQADINTVNAAFQAKQYDLNTGFQKLFQAQAFTNEMQNAFNKKQVGINKVYDAMWEEQQQRDLTQEYLIEYNRILAESRNASRLVFRLQNWQSRVVLDDTGLGFNSHDMKTMDFSFPFSRPGKFGFSGYIYSGINEYGTAESSRVRERHDNPIVAVSGVQDYTPSRSLSLPSCRQFVTNEWELGSHREITVAGFITPFETLPHFQERLDALTASYRAKGLRV